MVLVMCYDVKNQLKIIVFIGFQSCFKGSKWYFLVQMELSNRQISSFKNFGYVLCILLE